jgi:hypothetical protein
LVVASDASLQRSEITDMARRQGEQMATMRARREAYVPHCLTRGPQGRSHLCAPQACARTRCASSAAAVDRGRSAFSCRWQHRSWLTAWRQAHGILSGQAEVPPVQTSAAEVADRVRERYDEDARHVERLRARLAESRAEMQVGGTVGSSVLNGMADYRDTGGRFSVHRGSTGCVSAA